MAQPLTAALPPDLRLWGGCTFSITALNPTTGAAVAGVTVSDVHIEVEQTAGFGGELLLGPFMLVTGPGR